MIRSQEVIKVFTEINDTKTMKRLFEEVFTPAEIQDVALRWRLMNMLHEGIPQREIAGRLGISLCKITRGSRVLKAKNSVTKKILDKKIGVKNASRKKTRIVTKQ
jgi:TrpR family trp operon transcriptional repressor